MKKLIALFIALLFFYGCVTVKSPDGIVTTTPDANATIAILQASIETAQIALESYINFAKEQNKLQESATQREILRQQVRIEQLQQLLTTIRSTTNAKGNES